MFILSQEQERLPVKEPSTPPDVQRVKHGLLWLSWRVGYHWLPEGL